MTPIETMALAEIAELTVGYAFKSNEYSQEGAGRRLIRGENIAQGNLRWENTKWWPWDADVDPRYDLHEGDLVLAMDRPWIEAGLKYAQVNSSDLPALLVQRVARLRAKPGVHQRYLSYVLGGRTFTNYVLAVQTGTSIPHISGSQILGFRLVPHPFSEQQAIAEVLGALDDKIAANTKIAQTADDLAVASFHHAARGATYTGETFADVAKVSGGGTPSTKVPNYWGGDISWATPTDITALAGPYLESTSRTITEEGLVACSSELFAPGAILMTSRATIGAFAVAQVPTAVNQGFIVVEPKDETLRYWMLHDMRSRVDEFIAMANGATFLELSRGNFKKFQIHVAEVEVMHRFGERAAALHDSARQALRENQALAKLRDTLLPELISGRLRVHDAEAIAAEAVL